jgi:hypothetical protein
MRLHSPDVERVLVSERIVVQELHGHRRRQLLRRLKQPHQQRGLDEVRNQALGQPCVVLRSSSMMGCTFRCPPHCLNCLNC